MPLSNRDHLSIGGRDCFKKFLRTFYNYNKLKTGRLLVNELITNANYSLNDLRFNGIKLDLTPDAIDEILEGSIVPVTAITPNAFDQLFRSYSPIGSRHQEVYQP